MTKFKKSQKQIVSKFSQGKTCFHCMEPLFSLQVPCFHYRDFPVNPCTSLLGIAVWACAFYGREFGPNISCIAWSPLVLVSTNVLFEMVIHNTL